MEERAEEERAAAQAELAWLKAAFAAREAELTARTCEPASSCIVPALLLETFPDGHDPVCSFDFACMDVLVLQNAPCHVPALQI